MVVPFSPAAQRLLVGFVGIGNMGAAMATRLLGAGELGMGAERLFWEQGLSLHLHPLGGQARRALRAKLRPVLCHTLNLAPFLLLCRLSPDRVR